MKKSITGAYRNKVTLQFPSGTILVDGVDQTNYVTGATVWAAFDAKPPKSRQTFIAQVDVALSTRWIKIRYIEGITSQWRVKYNTTIFKIVSPPLDDGMRHRELYLECEVVE